jgi:hypothetical protein
VFLNAIQITGMKHLHHLKLEQPAAFNLKDYCNKLFLFSIGLSIPGLNPTISKNREKFCFL